jgi:hypothetical protein
MTVYNMLSVEDVLQALVMFLRKWGPKTITGGFLETGFNELN